MNKLIMLVGLPRSGKTTWALKRPFPIVNPDSIRLAIHGKPYIQDAERLVWAIAHYMVKALFLAGHRAVVLDATNTTRRRRDDWKSDLWKREFVIFSSSNAETCLKRVSDDHPAAEGLRDAIRRMAENFERLGEDEIEDG